jgi:hypothetical protein
MYKVLENSYGIEKIIELENKLKHNQQTIESQSTVLKDLRRTEKNQKKFIENFFSDNGIKSE